MDDVKALRTKYQDTSCAIDESIFHLQLIVYAIRDNNLSALNYLTEKGIQNYNCFDEDNVIKNISLIDYLDSHGYNLFKFGNLNPLYNIYIRSLCVGFDYEPIIRHLIRKLFMPKYIESACNTLMCLSQPKLKIWYPILIDAVYYELAKRHSSRSMYKIRIFRANYFGIIPSDIFNYVCQYQPAMNIPLPICVSELALANIVREYL